MRVVSDEPRRGRGRPKGSGPPPKPKPRKATEDRCITTAIVIDITDCGAGLLRAWADLGFIGPPLATARGVDRLWSHRDLRRAYVLARLDGRRHPTWDAIELCDRHGSGYLHVNTDEAAVTQDQGNPFGHGPDIVIDLAVAASEYGSVTEPRAVSV